MTAVLTRLRFASLWAELSIVGTVGPEPVGTADGHGAWLGGGSVGGGKDALTLGVERVGGPWRTAAGGHPADAGVTVGVVVPGEEPLRVNLG